MALSDNQQTTQDAMALAFQESMEALFPLPESMPEGDKETIKANWEKLGQAVAAILPAVMQHIATNAEVGTVVSDVVGATATQSNSGLGLVS